MNDGSELPLIDAIYAAALGERTWEAVLQTIRGQTDARLASLLILDHDSQLPTADVAASDDANWLALANRAYNTEFNKYDPTPALVSDWPVQRWYSDQEMFSPQQRARSIFYQEFMRPMKMGSVFDMFVHRGQHESAWLNLTHGPELHNHSPEATRAKIEALSPHLGRALRLQVRLRQLETQNAIAYAALDALSAPVFIVDEHRKLLRANAAAQALIRSEPALRIKGERFAPANCQDDAQWRAACVKGGLLLKRGNGEVLPLSIAPIPDQSRLGHGQQQGLYLVTAPDMSASRARAKQLRVFYGLTHTEAELALLVCESGLSPRQCADMRNVSITTVRSQIKAIYAKTGVTKATQLVQLVLKV